MIHNNRQLYRLYVIGLCVSVLGTSLLRAEVNNENGEALRMDSVNTIGYNIESQTSSVSSVRGEQLEAHPTDNLTNALGGFVTGYYAQQTGGEPGYDGSNYLIRGFRTLSTSNAQPLVLVDNFPADFSILNSEEIESIQVLKDAAATAIYGQRGANGVVLVKTRRGRTGKLNIKVNGQFGLQQLQGLPTFLDSYEYGRLFNEAKYNEGATEPFYSAEVLEAYRNQTGPNIYLYPNVDYVGQFLKTVTPIQRYTLSLQGGNDKTRYYAYLGLISQDGFYKYSVNDPKYSTNASSFRVNMRTNIDVQITKTLNLKFNVAGQITRNKSPYVGSSSIWSTIMHELPNSYPIFTPSGNLGGTSTKQNNLVGQMSRSGYREINNRNVQAMAEATQKLDFITPGLSVTLSAAYNGYNTYGYQKQQGYAVYSVAYDGIDYIETQYGLDTPLGEGSDMSNDMNYIVSGWGAFNYDRTFGKHSIQAVGMAYFDREYIPRYSPYSNVNYVLSANYGYDHRYFVGGSISRSGNDNYEPGKQFGTFYSVSGAWDLAQESFLKENRIVSELKLRASYGLVGNNFQNSENRRYLYQTQYGRGSGYSFGNNMNNAEGTIEMQSGNALFTWEKARQTNIGIDVKSFWGLYLNFDYYWDHRYDILASPFNKIPDIYGGTLSLVNVGIVNNQGLEAVLGIDKRIGEVSLNAELQASYYKNKVIENGEVFGLSETQKGIGKPSYGTWGLKCIGFFYDEDDIANSTPQKFGSYAPGDAKYEDTNGDGIVDSDDVTRLGGDGIPSLFTAFNLSLGYKGFDFKMQIVGLFDRMVWLPNEFGNAIFDGGKLGSEAYKRWAYYTDADGNVVDTRNTAQYPRLLTEKSINNTQNSTINIRNANFIRIKTLELGYTFRQAALRKVGLQDIRVYASAYNPFLLYDQLGIGDPEYPGACIWSYGKTRIFSVGLNLNF